MHLDRGQKPQLQRSLFKFVGNKNILKHVVKILPQVPNPKEKQPRAEASQKLSDVFFCQGNLADDSGTQHHGHWHQCGRAASFIGVLGVHSEDVNENQKCTEGS